VRWTNLSVTVVRVLLGGLFVFSGLNKLVGFMAVPPMPPGAAAFIGALAGTGYMLPLIGVIETAFGALLIVGRFVPLALTVLAPLVVNIVLFHVVLEPMLPVAAFLLFGESFLAWRERDAFAGLLRPMPPVREEVRRPSFTAADHAASA
jgi:putative oxidoreductase